ncbi:MAG: hypothetical protein HRT94_06840 [Alphaproteobacteria bacterium]|nr:hypothetical protein [Alphaproteobacteria bacterium]
MNDTTDTAESGGASAKSAFGDRGTNVNSGMVYGHPHGEAIIEGAKAIIRESATGNKLLVMLDKNLVPLHIMKGNGSNGFSPDMGTIILQIPSSVKETKGDHVIHLIKALHEAAQERAGFSAPNPHEDIMAYASFIHGRNLDSIVEVCKIVKELTNSSFYSVLLDSLKKIGLYNVYNAYLDGKNRDELYTEYAEAYETL